MTRWRLTFRAADGRDPPVECRVRRLLKVALRAYKLRCIAVEADTRPDAENAPAAAGTQRTGIAAGDPNDE